MLQNNMKKGISMTQNDRQKGAVSLFIVIFATLLIAIVTVSFVRIAVRDQQQATTADLSQSAYDSAQAGVEDAKRALLRYQAICPIDTLAGCAAERALLTSNTCNDSVRRVVGAVTDEVVVKQNSGDTKLDQAYTCVKVALDTTDFTGTLQADGSKLIPLTGTSAFDTVTLEWYSATDLQSSSDFSVDLQPASSLSQPLFAKNLWTAKRPSVMRAQLMQVGSTFTLTDFNDTNASSQSNANTLFLYPTGTGSNPTTIDSLAFGARDTRKSGTGAPQKVTCSSDLSGGGYACRVQLTLPTPINGGNRTAFLRLSALYNQTNYRISLSQASTTVRFRAVQPQIDVTGRANDLFRRLQTRVESNDNFPYPDATVDITGSLCKDFSVTDTTANYAALNALSTCTP
jgi:Tfp pilus assembly protein PilX